MAAQFATDGFVVITGAGSGIGRATARAFARNGAAGILFADLNEANAKDARAECDALATKAGYSAAHVCVNVTKESEVEHMFKVAKSSFGRVDAVVHSAGVAPTDAISADETPKSEFDRVIDVNLTGSFLVGRASIRAMKTQEPRTYQPVQGAARSLGRGSIVLISSVLGTMAMGQLASYTASKHGTQGLMKSLALEAIQDDIRINAMNPGWTETPLIREPLTRMPELEPVYTSLHPIGRLGFPEEIADSILYMCSPAASFMVGTSLLLDGGMTLNALRAA